MAQNDNQQQENRAFKKEDAYETLGIINIWIEYQGFICISISRSFNRCYI